MAKAKTKAAVSRKAAKAPARPAKAPKKAAPAKSVKPAAAKPAKASVAKTSVTKAIVAKAAVDKTAGKIDTPAPRKAEPLTLPAAKVTAAAVARPAPPARKVTDASRADLPPPDGFTLLVDGHFKNCFEDLKGAKAAASELKGRFPMLRVEIYDAAKKARLPA